MIGKTLGHYRVGEQLGRGGMGEVYVADDLNLNRKVALKFLPVAFSADPERMARFEREDKLLASLNHPNIAAIHGLEQAEGKRFLVLELVEGETLAQRLSKGVLPVEEALGVCRQIADALEAAHEKGVIHRDLKPANVMITEGDKVKILDFGLAKALSDETQSVDSSQSPTLTEAMTRPGVILGTAAYMSPEQAKGKSVDKRADIWAFGCILYECLTGKRAFEGETVTETLASVLTKEPECEKVPAKVQLLLHRCLQKDPKKRLRDIGDACQLLEVKPEPRQAKQTWLCIAWSVAAVLAVALGLAAWSPWRASPSSGKPLMQLYADLGSSMPLATLFGPDVIISPDGNRLVFVSGTRLFTRRLDQPKAAELAGTEGGMAPFFSPDSRWIAFFAGRNLKKISVEGGAAVPLCDATALRGGSWGEDGDIIAAITTTGSLSRIPSAGGVPAPVTELAPGEATHRWPQILPGGRAVLFTASNSISSFDNANIEVMSFKDRRRKTLQHGGTYGRYLPSGHLVYVSKSTLFAVPFDLDKLEVYGSPAPVLQVASTQFGAAQFDFSQNGTLIYRIGGATGGLRMLCWLDSAGKMQPLPAKSNLFMQPRLSPNGRLLLLTITSGSGSDIYTYDYQRDILTRLTNGSGGFIFPVWSPDGRFVAFGGGEGLLWTRADGAGKPQPLTASNSAQLPFSFSPDGKRLAFQQYNPASPIEIFTVAVENRNGHLQAGKPEIYMQTPTGALLPAFSPDGRWIAYMSSESGERQIYVCAFPNKGDRYQVSSNGGMLAVWSPNGRELFYVTEDQRIMVVTYTVKENSFVPDKPHLWTETRIANTSVFQNFDITPDGKRLVVLMPAEGAEEQKAQNHVTFLLNFFDELRRRVPTGEK
jgi:serine/threonine protein kinase/Tol biopolymer transport system component